MQAVAQRCKKRQRPHFFFPLHIRRCATVSVALAVCLILLTSRAEGMLSSLARHVQRDLGQQAAKTAMTYNAPRAVARRNTFRSFHQHGIRMTSSAGKTVGMGGGGDGGGNNVPRTERPPSVAVIGAGGAGLAAGRLLRAEGLRVTIFDKAEDLGGVWQYRAEPEARAPMYRSLVTNLPTESMAFLGYPFSGDTPSFPTHAQVLDYLRDYADAYDLRPLIKFGCPVVSVRPVESSSTSPPKRNSSVVSAASRVADSDHGNSHEVSSAVLSKPPPPPTEDRTDGGRQDDGHADGPVRPGEELKRPLGKWEVVYREAGGENGAAMNHVTTARDETTSATVDCNSTMNRNKQCSEIFDAVCVCNGHFQEERKAEAEGLEGFRGASMHALAYDRPDVEAFVGKRVLCVGSRSSGTDIAREVGSVATAVHVCDRAAVVTTKGGGEQGNICWRPALTRFEGENGVRFKDGSRAEVDTVVWCTGYNYSFPFLEGSGLLTPPVTERVHPLYEQIFHVDHPSLSFIGLPQSIVPFPLFELQANVVAAAMAGRMPLPSRAERARWLADDERQGLEERGVDPASRGVHVLHNLQWPYVKRLLQLAGGSGSILAPPPPQQQLGEETPVSDDAVDRSRQEDLTGSPSRRRVGDSNPDTSVVVGGDGVVVNGSSPPTGCTAGPGVEERQEATERRVLTALSELEKMLKVREDIYNDASDSRPAFPGAPDDYRRRVYTVDVEAGSFSVSMADRKANGELPSALSASCDDSGSSIFRSEGVEMEA